MCRRSRGVDPSVEQFRERAAFTLSAHDLRDDRLAVEVGGNRLCQRHIERFGGRDLMGELGVVEIIRYRTADSDVACSADAVVGGAITDADLRDADPGVVHQQLRSADEPFGQRRPPDRREVQAGLHTRRPGFAVIWNPTDVVEENCVRGKVDEATMVCKARSELLLGDDDVVLESQGSHTERLEGIAQFGSCRRRRRVIAVVVVHTFTSSPHVPGRVSGPGT